MAVDVIVDVKVCVRVGVGVGDVVVDVPGDVGVVGVGVGGVGVGGVGVGGVGVVVGVGDGGTGVVAEAEGSSSPSPVADGIAMALTDGDRVMQSCSVGWVGLDVWVAVSVDSDGHGVGVALTSTPRADDVAAGEDSLSASGAPADMALGAPTKIRAAPVAKVPRPTVVHLIDTRITRVMSPPLQSCSASEIFVNVAPHVVNQAGRDQPMQKLYTFVG